MVYYHIRHRFTLSKTNAIYVIWFAGVLLGSLFYFITTRVNPVFIQSGLNGQPTICGIFTVTLFPVLISALLYTISQKTLLLFCFIKSFCFGFSFCFISGAFNNNDWIIRYLMQFSGSCMSVLLLIYWYRLFSCSCKRIIFDTFVFSSISVIVSLLDLLYIIPFLRNFTITR